MSPRTITTETLRDLAESHGVCTRPIVHEVVDTETGRARMVSTPCGATLSSKCAPCADRARRVRMQQCREGWHLDEEPKRPEPDEDSGGGENHPAQSRRVRSTRRRRDTPNLPQAPREQRTVGRAFTTPSGRTYRPSMFVTLTLPSYGPVRPDGTPVDPDTYDYRRAALDTMHFPKLIDRVWQNIRRCTGFQAQYFAVVEFQRRLVPHLHTAIRGAIPRRTLRLVAEATYHQVWWPAFDHVVHPQHRLPTWDGANFVDPDAGCRLPTWDEAVDSISSDEPAHTLRLGKQLDIQGIIADEDDADRRVAYLTKYLIKSFGESAADGIEPTPRQRAHAQRIHQEARWLPCSSRCWNWLRYGVQPEFPKEHMVPGSCPGRGHQEQHLGFGGRRVLVSRRWTGKTLAGHRADRAEVVRQTLLAAGMDDVEVDRLSTTVRRDDGGQRYEWRLMHPDDTTEPMYRTVIARSLNEHFAWRAIYEAAKARASPAKGPPRPQQSSTRSRESQWSTCST